MKVLDAPSNTGQLKLELFLFLLSLRAPDILSLNCFRSVAGTRCWMYVSTFPRMVLSLEMVPSMSMTLREFASTSSLILRTSASRAPISENLELDLDVLK